MGFNIHIQINRVRLYQVTVSNSLSNKVFLDEPYDKLSNKFNRSIHKINYTVDEYNPNDYDLVLDDPNAWYYKYIFHFYKPSKKIESVEIFFQSHDGSKKYPLIFGFNEVGGNSYYYTYYFLRGRGSFTGTKSTEGLITKDDLLTRLLEERGLYESESYNKFLIRLGDKPNKSEVKYPKSGHNPERITLSKTDLKDPPNYVKYVHSIDPRNNVQSFYISFHEDSLFIVSDSGFGKLQSLDVYYNIHNGDTPLLFVFKFPNRIKLYKYPDFKSDLPNKTKNISKLEDFSSNLLVETLKRVYKEVHKVITFHNRTGSNRFISETAHRFNVGNKDEFRRVILKPNTDVNNKGSSSGPWEVFKDSLLTKAIVKKIDGNPFNNINDFKFESIYVYYTTYYEPLLIVFIGESDKKFFRISKGGKSWQNQDPFTIGNDFDLIPTLRRIEEEKNEYIQVHAPPRGPTSSHGRIQTPAEKTPVKKTPAQKTSKTVVPEVPKTVSYDIDLSKTTASNYGYLKNISVSHKKPYQSLQLFCYFTHAIKNNEPFNISSFKTADIHIKTIKVEPILSDVTSVNVYFSTYNVKKPIMLEISSKSIQTKYYINVFQSNHNYLFSSFTEVKKEEIIYKMITESDRINNTLTYQIEKSFKSDNSNYGYDNNIQVSKNVKQQNGFTIYTHEPKNKRSTKSYVLFNQNLLTTRTSDKKNNISDVQDKTYKSIKIYSLNSDVEFPLIIELHGDRSKSTYVSKKDGSGKFWEKENFDFSKDDNTYSKLREINYPLKKSVIIELDKNIEGEYDLRLIDNSLNYGSKQYDKKAYNEGKAHGKFKINVQLTSSVIDSRVKNVTDYKFFSHNIPELDNSLGVAGIRFFLTIRSGTDPQEITLYQNSSDASQSKNKKVFHYPPTSKLNKIYGYFYGSDSRPLLLCYDTHLYKRLNDNDSTKWVFEKSINCSESSAVLGLLKQVHGTMKRKLTFLQTGTNLNIATKEETVGSFKRFKFTAETKVSYISNSFTLPVSEIIKDLPKTTSLTKLLNDLKDKPFDSVSIYYEKSRSGTFLFEFNDESVKKHFQRVDEAGEYWIDKLVEYDNDSDLKDKLSQIKSYFNSTVVYEIDKTVSKYNSLITIGDQPDLDYEGFIGYKHNSSKVVEFSLILYRSEPLLKKDPLTNNITSFTDIHNKSIDDITVFFGRKVEEHKLPPTEDVPLLIIVNRGGSNQGSKSYYRHRRDYSGTYWEPVTDIPRIDETPDLLSFLREIEFDFLKSLVILTDYTSTYGENEIRSAISKLNVSNQIVVAGIENNGLIVTDKEQPECLRGSGFKYREYNIDRIKQNEWYGLRFFIKDSNGKNYNELTFHPFFDYPKEYLLHKRDTNNNKVYVFFYGNDPRPLLISYGNAGFIPNSISDYEKSWYRIEEAIDPEFCNSYTNNLAERLSEVVGILNEVNLTLRPSPASQSEPNTRGNEKKEYNLHTYDNKTFKARVSYRNMNCYRVYTHEAIGLGSDGSGFRLGNIKYNSSSFGNLEYDLTKQLSVVSIYYSIHDVRHQYPVLIQLNFRNEVSEFFMPSSKTADFWFSLNKNPQDYMLKYFRDSSSDKFEEGLYQIREDLGITFNSDDKNHLFNPEKCQEGSSNTTVVAAASGGTITTAALVGGGVTYIARPEWFIPVIRALV